MYQSPQQEHFHLYKINITSNNEKKILIKRNKYQLTLLLQKVYDDINVRIFQNLFKEVYLQKHSFLCLRLNHLKLFLHKLELGQKSHIQS